MKQQNYCSTVILLLNGKSKAEIDSTKEWFKKSRFLTCEAADVFRALEEICDFTVRTRPDVVLLEQSSLPQDFLTIRKIVQSSYGYAEIPIMALSDSGKTINHKDCFEGNLAELETQLNKILPKQRHAQAAA